MQEGFMADNSGSNAWMPTAGGVLSIIVGAGDLIGSLALFLLAVIGAAGVSWIHPALGSIQLVLFGFLGFWLVVTGVLAIVGGVMAVRRRNWGLALTGSIAALLGGGHLLGILAIVFTAIARKEFVS
jgi:hypothetical protein